MKKILILVSMIMIAGFVSAEVNWKGYPGPIEKGSFLIDIGTGLGFSSYGKMVVPPLFASVDYALPIGGIPFTVGGFFGFTARRDERFYGDYKYTGYAFGGRFGYHPDLGVKNLNVYAVGGLGWYIFKGVYESKGGYSYPYTDEDYSTFYFSADIGVRYFFTNNVGIFAEVGWSWLTVLKAGLALQF
jgi:hypothetical protein